MEEEKKTETYEQSIRRRPVLRVMAWVGLVVIFALILFDKDYPDNKLKGAVFTVYKDVNGNGIYEAEQIRSIKTLLLLQAISSANISLITFLTVIIL